MTQPANFSGVPQQPQAVPPYGMQPQQQVVRQQPQVPQQFGTMPAGFQGTQPQQQEATENTLLPKGGNALLAAGAAITLGATGLATTAASEGNYRWGDGGLASKLKHVDEGKAPQLDTQVRAQIELDARNEALAKLQQQELQQFQTNQLAKAKALVPSASSAADINAVIAEHQKQTPSSVIQQPLGEKGLKSLNTEIVMLQEQLNQKASSIAAIKTNWDASTKPIEILKGIETAEDIACSINRLDKLNRTAPSIRKEAKAAFTNAKMEALKATVDTLEDTSSHKHALLERIKKNDIKGVNQYIVDERLVFDKLPDLSTREGQMAYLNHLEAQPARRIELQEKIDLKDKQPALKQQLQQKGQADVDHLAKLTELEKLQREAQPVASAKNIDANALKADVEARVATAEKNLPKPASKPAMDIKKAEGVGKAWQTVDDIKAKGYTQLAEHATNSRWAGIKAGVLTALIGGALTVHQFLEVGKQKGVNEAREAQIKQLQQQQYMGA